MRTLTLCLFLICTIQVSAQKKLKFEKVGPMPRGVMLSAYTQHDDQAYLVGGATNTRAFNSMLQIFDAKTNDWFSAKLRDLPNHNHSTAIYVDEYKGILLAGGITGNVNTIDLVEELRIIYPDQLKVEVLGTIPEPAKNMGMAESKGLVYMFGGAKNRRDIPNQLPRYSFSNKLYAYDLSTGVVNELPNMPLAMETQGGIVDGNLYTFGGFSGLPRAEIWKYNIQDKKWTVLEPFNEPVSAYALTQYKHYFILVGDYNWGNQLILYNTKTETAEYFKTGLYSRQMSAAVIGDELHIYGGRGVDNDNIIKNQHLKISINQLIGNSKESIDD